MDPIILLILLGIGIYIYIVYFGSAPDQLDRNGNPIKKGRRRYTPGSK